MENIFRNKVIMVTGGCGSIGSEIVKKLLLFKPKAIRVFDNNESNLFYLGHELKNRSIRLLLGDIRDRNRVYRAMKNVDIVFHAAALKHVPLCEYNPFEAVSTNVMGTENLISAAIDNGVEKFIGISTDKAVNPINTMGATKLLSEKIIIDTSLSEMKTKFCCVRFGNVLDSVGSVIPIFKNQIKNGSTLTITDKDMTRFFMTMSDAISLVLKASEITEGGEIFILKMDVIRITDLAEALIEVLGPKYGRKPQDIRIEFIGKRAGEKMHESLMTEEEAAYAKDIGDMYALKHPSVYDSAKQPKFVASNNSKNVKCLGIDEIKRLLRDAKII